MMAAIPPIPFRWDGEAMIPRHPKLADRHFVVEQDYVMVEYQPRSPATHSHQFAWLHDAWLNLPENLAEQFPTAEHLRKRCLIDAGFYDEMIVDVGSNAAAIRAASAFRKMDDFAHVVVRGPIVAIRTAKSQSHRSMDKAEFQASKTAVLETVAALIGVSPATLAKQAEQAA